MLGTGAQVRVGAVGVERDWVPADGRGAADRPCGAVRLEERIAASLPWPVLVRN